VEIAFREGVGGISRVKLIPYTGEGYVFDEDGPWDQPLPALEFGVEAEAHGYRGGRLAAIARDALRRFVAQMEMLERMRSGEATLSALSPEDFTLTVRVVDRAGHVVLTVRLRAGVQGILPSNEPLWHEVVLGFSLDPTTLPGIVDDLHAMMAELRDQLPAEHPFWTG
jgi:hypothetical protein